MITAIDLSKSYQVDGQSLTVLHSVSLQIKIGEFVAIVGKSGSGKTTLLSLLSGLDQPSSGSVELNGQRIDSLDEEALAPLRQKSIGFIFQSFHLIPTLTALENVMIPAQLAGLPSVKKKASDLLERVGLADRMRSRPQQLSGGEQQRVAICRALINDPTFLFADEPTGNLDSESGQTVMNLLLALRAERSLVLVTHDVALANQADRRIELQDGKSVNENHSDRQRA